MSGDDDINKAIIAAAKDAPSDVSGHTLTELYTLVSTAGVADSLDVLNLLSVLLPCKDPAARDLIAIMGECSSAKEVVMAVQEEVEKVAERAENDDEDKVHEGLEKTGLVERLTELVELYRAAIPRLKLRKRTASETLQPLLPNLQRAIEATSTLIKSAEAIVLMSAVGSMVAAALNWVKNLPSIDSEELGKCKSLLKSVLDHTLVLCRHFLGCDTAHKAFEMCFPMFNMGAGEPKGEEGRQIIDMYASIYNDLGYAPDQLICSPSTVSIILLAHHWVSSSAPQVSQLLLFTPNILTMLLPTSNLQDDALAFLLLVLHRNWSGPRNELSPEIINTFLPQLTVLSSAHPSPSTRHQAFRILSVLLASGPSQLRLQLLADLVAKCEFPQMRVAAVGLVKDAVLEALDPKSTNTRSVFCTPMFMRVFGPLLFRPSPPEMFEAKIDLEEFSESPEPKRITEVLSLYYVVLVRDRSNQTGIRDKDMLTTVEKNLLHPLRGWLATITDGDRAQDAHGAIMMPLVSLRMGLNRIEEAKACL